MKFRIIFYAIFAIVFQVVLGQITGQGQGSIGILLFGLLIEIDPKFSFRYLFQKINPRK